MLHEQAELTGTVHQGVIVIDDGVELPEGQTVKIIFQPAVTVEAKPESNAAEPTDGTGKTQPALSPLAQMLLSHAGTVDDWPADFALNHDHYLYGADKRQ
jgi:hypothetical protein